MSCGFRLTSSALTPAVCMAMSREPVVIWVETHTSHLPSLSRAVQFIGSIGACERKGAWYTASIFLVALASAVGASPILRATAPSFDMLSANDLVMPSDVRLASLPSSQ